MKLPSYKFFAESTSDTLFIYYYGTQLLVIDEALVNYQHRPGEALLMDCDGSIDTRGNHLSMLIDADIDEEYAEAEVGNYTTVYELSAAEVLPYLSKEVTKQIKNLSKKPKVIKVDKIEFKNNVVQLFTPRTTAADSSFADLIQKNKDRAAAIDLERNDYNMRIVSNMKMRTRKFS